MHCCVSGMHLESGYPGSQDSLCQKGADPTAPTVGSRRVDGWGGQAKDLSGVGAVAAASCTQ